MHFVSNYTYLRRMEGIAIIMVDGYIYMSFFGGAYVDSVLPYFQIFIFSSVFMIILRINL